MYPANRLAGKRLFITDATEKELETAALHSSNVELATLDPPVGVFDKPTNFAIHTSNGVHIGMCSMYNYTGARAELGIRIWDKMYWDRGYGTETVSLLCEWTFKHTKVDTIILKTPTANTRAIKCYQKCGFVQHATGNIDGHTMVFMQKRRDAR